MSEDEITLYDLLNLSIGTPQLGAVNFSALHALLQAVLRQLDIREVKIRWSDPLPGDTHTDALMGVTGPGRDPEGEQLQIEGDMKQAVPGPGPELEERISASSGPTPDPGGAADGESKLRSRIQTCEDGVSKAMRLIQTLHTQKDSLKDQINKLHQHKVVGAEAETVAAVESCCHRVDALEETVRCLRDTFQKYPDPEDLSRCVTWDIMQSALLNREENHQELIDSGVVLLRPTHDPFNSNLSALNTSPHPTGVSGRTAAPTPPVTSGEALILQEDPGTQPTTETSLVPSGPTHPEAGPVAASLSQTGSEQHSETVEALRNIGKLRDKFKQLEARVAALEEGKVDQTQLAELRDIITDQASQDVTVNLMDELKEQTTLIDSLTKEQEKSDSLEDMFMTQTSQDRDTSSEAASGSEDSETHELRQQMSVLRRSVQKLEEGLKQLKTRQALSEQRLRDQNLQDQLDNLRGRLEDMILSLTSKLSSSLQEEGQGLGQGKEGSAGTTSTVNIGGELSRLFQHYEHLQDTVNSLLQQQTGSRAGMLQDREDRQSVDLVNDVQAAILQLQAECEKLHEMTRCLNEDNRQKQNHIQELFKTTEELEEKKADKLMVEIEIKADKSALESKVSRLQFDSATEQLNTMFHQLQDKVTDQAHDWHKVMDKLSTEMECKLVRTELDSVKKQLEDCRKNIDEKLQGQGAAEHEDAAALRKQLVDRFHCLSCDRPVVKQTPGPHLMTLPSSPGFPSHRSIRPFTVYALEQFRQHYRSERIAELTDYSHLAVSRSCGGSHTVTSASQRRTGLQNMKHHGQPDGEGMVQSEEVDIVGLDGHIYRGRLNAPSIRTTETKLPTISTKDVTAGVCRTKDKAKCSPSYKSAASPEVGHSALGQHPLSVKSAQCSRSASSCSGRDWPVSAVGCPSQSSVTQASAAAESGSEVQLHQSDL